MVQEQEIGAPGCIRDLAGWLDRLGFSANLQPGVVITWGYYNGFDCKGRSDHATWHEKAAHGLVHTLKLVEIFTLGPVIQVSPSQTGREPFQLCNPLELLLRMLLERVREPHDYARAGVHSSDQQR